MRLAYLVSFAATITLATIAPRAALAQLNLGLGGSLVVTVTAPANGTAVSGTIDVQGKYTTIGALTVQQVQLKLDGADLGAAHVHAPVLGVGAVTFDEAWDTSRASNGAHTLTAVARDALGVEWTSNAVAVTVFNSPVASENEQPG